MWKPAGRGKFQRVRYLYGDCDMRITERDCGNLEACLCGRGVRREKVRMTEALYRSHDEVTDMYNFIVI